LSPKKIPEIHLCVCAMNSARNGKICRLQCEIFGWDKTRFKVLRNDKFRDVSRPASIFVIENAGMVVPWIRLIVDGRSSRKLWFRTGSVNGGFLVDKVALGQNLLLVSCFHPSISFQPRPQIFN